TGRRSSAPSRAPPSIDRDSVWAIVPPPGASIDQTDVLRRDGGFGDVRVEVEVEVLGGVADQQRVPQLLVERAEGLLDVLLRAREGAHRVREVAPPPEQLERHVVRQLGTDPYRERPPPH